MLSLMTAAFVFAAVWSAAPVGLAWLMFRRKREEMGR